MRATVERHLLRAAGLLWHFRQAGPAAAPTVVLLHPSPRSSALYEPWMSVLGERLHVLAIDTPGYGDSEPLPHPVRGLRDFVGPLRALLQALSVTRFVLYGSATGAQLGIAYAGAYPQDLAHLVLDNAAHFDDAERQRIMQGYFPDLTPRADGSHLATAWRMCAQSLEFFPWFAADEAHRIAPGPPCAAQVQALLCDLLAAGPGYAAGYRAAFEHERAEHVQALTVPTSLLRWRGSPLLRYIDRLVAQGLPAHVRVVDIPAPPAERQAAMTAHLLRLTASARAC